MSTVVDERIVSMQFDNKHFEKNVQTSINTLGKFKQSLNLTGASKGLDTTSKSLEQLEYASYKAGLHWSDIKAKFSSVIEWNIARHAVNALTSSVKNLASQLLGLPSIKSGLSEYETQLGAIQTILANTESKGSTLDDVNTALDELNTYADKTIYNFTEMTKNIGTFTAAGVDLDTSVSAIKGIANLAAVSGSTSQQASTAMYQLSQALASGTVKLMDWNSVVNAGMGGQVFQDALKETARVHGVAIDEMIETQGSFRETLSEGWLTSEILTETLSKFTGDLTEEQLKSMGYTEDQIAEIIKLGQTATDAATKVKTFSQLLDTLKETAQSGWAQTWELVFGDFNEAKAMWSNISDLLGGALSQAAESRNKLLSGTLDSGWKQFLSAGVMDEGNFGEYLKKAAKERGKTIDHIFDGEGNIDESKLRQALQDETITADMFKESLADLNKLYETRTDEQLKNLGYTEDEIKALRELNEEIQNGGTSIDEYINKMKRLSGRELLFNAEFAEDGTLLINERTGALINIGVALAKVFTTIKDAWVEIFPPATSEQLYNILEAFREFTSHLVMSDETADKFKRTLKGVFAVLDIVFTIIKTLGSAIFTVLGSFDGLGGSILTATASLGDFLVSFRDAFKQSKGLKTFADSIANIVATIIKSLRAMGNSIKVKFQTSGLESLVDVLKAVWKAIKTIAGGIINVIAGIATAFSNTFTGSGVTVLLDILNAGLLTSLILGVKKLVSGFGEVTGLIDNIKGILDSVGDTFKAFQQKIKAEALKTIAVSIALLAGSLLLLSLLDKEKLEESLAAMTMLFAGLMGSMAIIGRIDKVVIGASQLLGLAASIFILAIALKKLSSLDGEEIKTGIKNMAVSLGILIGALAVMSKISSTKKMSTKGAAQLLKITLLLYVLAGALKLLGSMPWEQSRNALKVMAGALIALVGALAVMSKISSTKSMSTKGAKQILVMTLAMIPLAIAFKMLGQLGWEEIAKGSVVMIGGLIAMVAALKVMSLIDKASGKVAKTSKVNNTSIVIGKCAQLTLIAIALGVLALSLALVSRLSWDSILTGLGTMVLTLGVLIGGLAILSKIPEATIGKASMSLVTLSFAVLILANTLESLGKMSWKKLATGVIAMGAALLIIVGTLKLMEKVKGTGAGLIKTAVALAIMAVSIRLIGAAIESIGKLDLGTIAKGLLGIAGILAVFVIASNLLGPAIPSFMALAGGIALLGLACLAAGAGIMLIAEGLSLMGDRVGEAIETLCQAIVNSAASIGKAAEALLISLLDALVNVTDKLVLSLLEIIINTLDSLAAFTPQIVTALMDLVIGVLDKIIDYIPDIVKLCVKVFTKIFEGITEALKDIDPEVWIKGLIGVGLFAGLIAILGAIAGMIPMAMLGVLGMGAVAAELAIVLGTLGLLSKIPGLMEFIQNGGDLLEKIGTAIGQFIGGLAGGIAKGFTSSLPEMGTDLSNFMKNLEPFLEAIKELDASVLANAKTLAQVLLTITAASLLESLTSWLTGSSSMTQFTKELVTFGDGISEFAKKVKGIDQNSITAAAKAGKTLAEMAESIPKSGGLFQLFGGKHNLTNFATDIANFGEGLDGFDENVKDINPETIKAAAEAGKTLAEMAEHIPETGGLFQMFSGNNNLSAFAVGIKSFGAGLKGFAKETADVDPAKIKASGEAAKVLIKATSSIPTEGGLWSYIVGGQDLTSFGVQLISFGEGIAGFAKAIDETNLEKVHPAAKAGEALGKMAGAIPTTGGLWEVIGGTSNLSLFALQIKDFGKGLAGFVDSISETDFSKVAPATVAGLALAKMAQQVPTTGGLWSYIDGDNSLGTFATQIGYFADGIVGFTKTIAEAEFSKVAPSVTAGLALAGMAKQIPESGGLFTPNEGVNNMSSFKTQIVTFGEGIAGFTKTIAEAEFSKVAPSVTAGLALAGMAKQIPESGGLFTPNKGVNNMSSFKTQIITFAEGMVGFAKKIAEAGNGFGDVNGAVTSGNKLVELAKQIPESGGLFTPNKGVNNMSSFKTQIITFAEGMVGFAKKIGDTNFTNSISAISSGLRIAEIAVKISNVEISDLGSFTTSLGPLATAIVNFVSDLSEIDTTVVGEICAEIERLVEELNNTSTDGIEDIIKSFESARTETTLLSVMMINAAILIIEGSESRFRLAGNTIMLAFINGLKEKSTGILDTFINTIESALGSITSESLLSEFRIAGANIASGFAGGIKKNAYKAKETAVTMATSALKAAKKALGIESPSKEFYETGLYCAEGLTNALAVSESKVYDSGYSLGDYAKQGLQNVISTISSLIENDMDVQPTIKPVLDLSNISNGASTINSMFGMNPSVGVLARVNSIGSSMNKIQNGGNDDVVSAIKDLEGVLGSTSGDTYNIGINNTADEEVKAAINTLVRAALVGGRS